MGCTSSSLRGADPHRDDLTTQDIAPTFVASQTSDYAALTSRAAPEPVTTKSMQRRESSTKQMLEAYSHRKSSFMPTDAEWRSNRVSKEKAKKQAGMTRDELMAEDDKKIYRGKRSASTIHGSGASAMAFGPNNGIVGAY